MKLEGKVIVITGAASGIGRTAATLFAREGGRVVIADIDESAARSVAADIDAEGGTCLALETDVTNPESVKSTIRTTVKEFGKIDVLYNNAGGSRPSDGKVTDINIEAFWQTIKIDLFGTWLCCKFGIPELIKAGGGSVVNMSSITAIIGHLNLDAYTAAKGGIAALTRSMAVEFASHRVRVNAIAPGATKTERIAKLEETGRISPSLLNRHLLGLLEPINIAKTALFLASDDSFGMTGQVVVMDSGATTTAVLLENP